MNLNNNIDDSFTYQVRNQSVLGFAPADMTLQTLKVFIGRDGRPRLNGEVKKCPACKAAGHAVVLDNPPLDFSARLRVKSPCDRITGNVVVQIADHRRNQRIFAGFWSALISWIEKNPV